MSLEDDSFKPFNLSELRGKIQVLASKLPEARENGIPENDHDAIRSFADELQTILEEFNTVLNCIGCATYKWTSAKSGAREQDLGTLAEEIVTSQGEMLSTINAKLSHVLQPRKEIVITRCIVEKKGTKEHRTNVFGREIVDPELYHYNCKVLARMAYTIRHEVKSIFFKVALVMEDYLKADDKSDKFAAAGYHL